MKLLPDLGLEETTSKEFTGWEGRGAMGGWTDLGTDLHQRLCFFNLFNADNGAFKDCV